jgi:hypothetical protein
MTERQAKEILKLYRPGSADANDPEFAEALAFVQQSPDLKTWFDAHCAIYQTLSSRIREIEVPDALREQIVSEHNARVRSQNLRKRVTLALASVALAISLASLVQYLPRRAADDQSFEVYRSRMVRHVLSAYSMDVVTNDLAQIRTHLAQRGAPEDWKLSAGLSSAMATGGGVLDWHGRPVSMICFRTGQPLAEGKVSDMYLLVVDGKDLRDPVEEGSTKIESIHEVTTATWISEGKVYVLAVEGNEEVLRRYL